MQKNIWFTVWVVLSLFVGVLCAGAITSSVTPAASAVPEATAASVAPVISATATPTVPVAPAVPVAEPAPVAAPATPAPIVPAEPAMPEAQPAAPEESGTSDAQPTAASEQVELNQTIEKDIAVEPKVFAPAPDITQETQPSKPLQEESAHLAPEKVAVDDKEFGEQPVSHATPAQEINSDLDTTAVDAGGNWLIKRAFWEQAERTYEKIMEANSVIYEQQINFVKSHNAADDLSDKSFREIGFEQGQLSQLVDRLLDEVKTQREKQGELTEQERQLLQTLKEKQQEVERLKLNLEAIEALDNSLDQTMLKLNNQVTECRNYEKRAWENFKTIGRELNDKKARILFYEMEGFLKTVEKNRDYMSGQLSQYFSDTVANIKTKFDELASKVNEAKQKGLDLTSEFQRFVRADQQKDREAHERTELVATPEQQKPAPVAPQTWFGSLMGAVKSIWHYWSNLVSRGFAKIAHLFGK